MKRNWLVVFVVLAVVLTTTACVVTVPVQTQDNNQQVFVVVESPCDTCAAEPAAPSPEPSPTAEPAPTATQVLSENPALEPLQPKDWADSTNYPTIFKGQMGDVFYCGALAVDAQFPEGFKTFETWPKTAGDGNYLHADKTNEYSMYAFCHGDTPEKHFAPSGTLWTEVLLENNGFEEVTFPLE